MIKVYAELIRRKLMTIKQVPKDFQEAVKEELAK